MDKQSAREPVVITGTGVVAPNGIGVTAFWSNCCAGVSGVKRITTFDVSAFDAQIAGVVSDFDPAASGISAIDAQRFDRYVLFALAAAQEAVTASNLFAAAIDHTRVGVCIATAIAGTKYMEEEFLRLTAHATQPINPELASRNLYSGASFHVAGVEVARRFNAQGPLQTLATGCTAGLDAIGHALEMIRSGQADVVIAGASEAPLTPIALAAFDIIGALSSRCNAQPAQASRPYDKTRSGFVLGEGCGIFVLESKRHALKRGATILAEINGFGSSCNAYHMTDLAPDGNDLHRAMQLSLADAGIDAAQIDHVNAHGSSTPQNDVNETNAVKKTLGQHAYQIPVCSLKSIVGHALAAANAIELVAAVQSLRTQQVSPTLNYQMPDPDCDLDYVAGHSRTANIAYLLKDASGFSGIHSALILARSSSPTAQASQASSQTSSQKTRTRTTP